MTMLLTAALLLLAAGCGSDDAAGGPPPADTDPDLDAGPELELDVALDQGDPELDSGPSAAELVEEGKLYLAQARPYEALLSFEAALLADPDSVDALFGAALAELIEASELMAMIISLAGQLESLSVDPPPTRNEYVAEELHGIFMKLRARFQGGLDKLELIGDRELTFTVEAAWLFLGVKPVLCYRGTFDQADVHLMRSTASFILFLFDLICGQDLNADVLTLVSMQRHGDLADLGARGVVELLVFLLESDPRFLGLHQEDGEAMFQAGREHLASVGPELRRALELMAGRDGPDYVTTLRSGPEETIQVVVRNRVQVSDEGEASEEELAVCLTPSMVDKIEALSESLDAPGTVLPFAEGPLALVATMMATAASLGLLDLSSLPLQPEVLDAPHLYALGRFFLPGIFAVDLATFFLEPAGLGLLMPGWTSDPHSGGSFIMEWECPDDLDEDGWPAGWQNLSCSDAAEVIDSAHFIDTESEIQADGYLSNAPHMVFEDPTFNGLLLVDLSSYDLPGHNPPGFAPTTLGSLNTGLSAVLGNLLAVLSMLE